MDQTATDIRFPKLPLFGAAAVALIAIGSVAAARLSTLPAPSPVAAVPVLESRSLSFEDASNGSVIVRDGKTGETVAIAAPGTNGFLRGTLRGLMRTRMREDIDLRLPMTLSKLENGAIVLADETDGVTLALDAYGQTNADVFRAFLRNGQGGT